MANFSTTTEANIQRANDIAAGDAVGWADATGAAIQAMRNELGDASLLGTVGGTGNVLTADDDGRLPADNLPAKIPTDNLPTGTDEGSIPLIGADGLIDAAILGSGGLSGLTTEPGDANFSSIGRTNADTSSTVFTPNNADTLQALFVIAVGGGGDVEDNYIGQRGQMVSGLIPAFALTYSDGGTLSVATGRNASISNPSYTTDSLGVVFDADSGTRAGIENYILAEGGISRPTGGLLTPAQATAVYTTEALTGYDLSAYGLTNPSRTATINLSDGTTTDIVSTGFGAPNIDGIVLIWEIY